MVDPVSGNGASLASRLGLQAAGAKEAAGAGKVRTEPADAGRSPPISRALVSEGLEAARRMIAEPPVDSSRVAELRDAIAGGRYQIDPERIADAMLRSEPGPLRG